MAETTRPKLSVNREEARQKIQARIEKGQQLRNKEIRSDDELEKARAESEKWSKYNKVLLSGLFDNTSVAEYDYANFDDFPGYIGGSPSFSEKLGLYQKKGMDSSINTLEGICERLELYAEPSETSQSTFGKEVFIVHGHDQAAKHAIAGFVRKFGLNAIILDEQANRGQTIIEKFEENADEVGFAIILLTPDDVGAPKDKQDEFKPRARQNVVLELGYFMAKLGRERVCPLLKDEVEKPSDIDGLVYVPMNSPNEWQLQLAKEMKQAGLPIDLNKLA